MTAPAPLLHPPQARLAVRVGVTGHRPNRLLDSDEALLRDRIRSVLQTVATVTDQILTETGDAYTPEPPALRVLSSLAEGADRLVAEEALALHYELHCPLPFDRDDYARDFATDAARAAYYALLDRATAVLELVHDRATAEAENEAYEAAGRVMLRQSDVLLVLWNGAEPAGQGGTGQIVKEALQQQIPCVWIHADAPHSWVVLREQDLTAAGTVTAEAQARLTPDGDRTPLVQHLRAVLQPPPPPRAKDSSSKGMATQGGSLFPAPCAPRPDYFAETPPRWAVFGLWFTAFRHLVLGQWRPLPLRYPTLQQTLAEEWRNARPAAPDLPDAVDRQVEDQFGHHYVWADQLAKYYADLYRSSYLLTYLFSAIAVLFALLSFAWSDAMQAASGTGAAVHHAPGFDYGVAGEMMLILIIMVSIVLGRRCRWHERWIDYRSLAEQFRQMRFLALLGHHPPGFRLPAHHAYDTPYHAWVYWHSRAVIRAAGLVNARIDAAYREAYRQRLLGSLQETNSATGEIPAQVHYHHHNAQQLVHIAHHLHRGGLILFGLTFVVCVDHLIFHRLPLNLAMVLAGAAPAFGAALAGILMQGEFERLAKRSEAMHHALATLMNETRSTQATPTFHQLSRLADQAAEIMMTEVLDWRMVVLEKSLELPG